MNTPLIPVAVEAHASRRGRLSFGFVPRFFLALLAGFVWLIPAWWSPRFATAMFVWDAVVVAALLYDLVRLPRPGALSARRAWSAAPSLARGGSVEIAVINHGRRFLRVHVVDETPMSMSMRIPELRGDVAGGAVIRLEYPILPAQRGDAHFGRLFLRYRAPWGLAERWVVAELSQDVRVTPDLEEARDQALYLIRSRQVEMEKRRRRQRSLGREFESLREYRQGDDPRDICWPATARRHELVTRVYEAERSQPIWLVVDAGRLMRAQVNNSRYAISLSKLDYAVNAALSVAQVATQSGDRVGLVGYGRAIQQTLTPGHGGSHIRAMVDALSMVRAEANEANHGLAARWLLQRQSRRSLVIWITDFAETPATPEVIESAAQTGRKHLVLFAAVSQPDVTALAEAIPRTEEEMFRHAAVLEIVERRELLLRELRQRGVLVAEQYPCELTTSLVNHYLEVKDRGRL
ncbi:MAG: DUF58 domain-containing protein [Acidobacteriaceae bacterium]|nr:DUF58 domain-containing protein [Acidobacteriaceae bacterium]